MSRLVATQEIIAVSETLTAPSLTGGVKVGSAGIADTVGFYGTTPIAQPSGNAQAALTRGAASGSVCTAMLTSSPTAVGPNTTVESGLTIVGSTGAWRPASGDLFYVNKPTSQAGLGVGNVRFSSAGIVGVNFSNFTAATVTPTATQNYAVVGIRGFTNLSTTISPAAVAPNTTAEQTFALTGLRVNDLVMVNKPTQQAGLDIMGCRVAANNSLGITFGNVTAATITPTASESYSVISLGGMDATDNEIVMQCSVGTVISIANATTTEYAVPASNILATDVIKGVSKPTAQATLGIVGYRVSAAGTIGVTFGNTSAATATPTANEVYGITVQRQAPVAPLLLYTQALTPVAVAPNTTAEQTFTVTGLISGTPVWVNKPTATAGLGIVGVRVSASSTLAINYGNATAATITPPAETYIIGNFQLPFDSTTSGNSYVQSAAISHQQKAQLTNALRTAMVNLGEIAGA